MDQWFGPKWCGLRALGLFLEGGMVMNHLPTVFHANHHQAEEASAVFWGLKMITFYYLGAFGVGVGSKSDDFGKGF